MNTMMSIKTKTEMVLNRSSSGPRQEYQMETINIHKSSFSGHEKDDHKAIMRETEDFDLYLSENLHASDGRRSDKGNVSPNTYKLNLLCKSTDFNGQNLCLSQRSKHENEPMTHKKRSSSVAALDHNEKSNNEKTNKPPVDDDHDSVTMNNTNNDDNEENREATGFPNLSERELLDKLQDMNVVTHYKVIQSLRNINMGNLGLLERLDRTEPAMRRILTKTRLTMKDVKETSVDSDIQATVNEFLQTNVTGNFIMARVLRENYNLFYTWLTAHLQMERNAWAARLRIAMEEMDKQRKGVLQNNNLVERSSKRLNNLIMSCCEAFWGIPNIVKKNSHQNDHKSLTPAHVSEFHSESVQDGHTKQATFSNKEKLSSTFRQHNHGNMIHNPGMQKQIRADGAEFIDSSNDVSTSSTNIEQELCFTPEKCYKHKYNDDNSKRLSHSKKHHDVSKISSEKTNEFNKAHAVLQQDGEFCSFNGKQGNVDKPESCNEGDDNTDWGRVMSDSITALADVCEKLIDDRLTCLRLVGVTQCPSLTAAVAAYIQGKDCMDQPKFLDVDEKIALLEDENTRLFNEINVSKDALTEKCNEAIFLQERVARLEALLTNSIDPSTISTFPHTNHLGNTNIQAKQRSNKYESNSQPIKGSFLGKITESVISKRVTSNGFYMRDERATRDKDVHLIMPHSIKLTPEDKNRASRVRQEKSYRINSNFTDTESSSDNSKQEILHKTHKRLTIVSIQDSIRDSTSEMETIVNNKEQQACACQDRVTTLIKDASFPSKSSRFKKVKADHCKKLIRSSNSVHSQSNGNTTSGSITNTSTGDLMENGADATIINEDLDLFAERISTSTTNVTDESCKSSLNNGHKVGQRIKSRNISIHQAETEAFANRAHVKKRMVQTQHDINKNKPPLTTRHDKETNSVLPQVKQQGKTPIFKCFRCNKLLTRADNHALACSYYKEAVTSDHSIRTLPSVS